MLTVSRRLRHRRTVLALLLGLAGGTATEAALVPYDLPALAARSRYIVCGEVVATRSFWGQFSTAGEVLLTEVRIRVTETWKKPARRRPGDPNTGDAGIVANDPAADPEEVTVRLLGGKIGERWQYCPESPAFAPGEKVLVFARPWDGHLWVTGWAQGKYRLRDGADRVDVIGGPRLPISRRSPLHTVREEVRRALASNPSTTSDAEGSR